MNDQKIMNYDFKIYNLENDFDLIKNWKIFISPEGQILRVAPFDNLESNHDSYVFEYFKKVLKRDASQLLLFLKENHPKCNSYNYSYKDLMIDYFGYVDFENNVIKNDFIIGKPDYEINKHKTTNQQIKVLLRLLSKYNANPDLIFQALEKDGERISQHHL